MALKFSQHIVTQRLLVTKTVAACFLAAFLSNYIQIAGLWSADGVTPVTVTSTQNTLESLTTRLEDPSTAPLVFPSLFWHLDFLGELKAYFPSLAPHTGVDTALYLVTFTLDLSPRSSAGCRSYYDPYLEQLLDFPRHDRNLRLTLPSRRDFLVIPMGRLVD
jgi:hypothetical protein